MQTLITLTLSGSALALLLLILGRAFGSRLSSTVYYYAWLLVLLRFLLPLPGLIPTGSGQAEPARPVRPALYDLGEGGAEPVPEHQPVTAAQPAPVSEAQLPEAELPASASAPASEPQPTAPAVSVDWRSPRLWLTVWAVGAAACFLWPVVSYLRFTAALRRRLLRPGKALRAYYASLPGRKPALSLCPALQTPLMFGVFAPRIVLPAELAEEPALLDRVLRHELCHYRRRDPLYKWFAAAVLALHWFNPLSWLIRRELNRACELSCDEMLLRSMDRAEKQAYGETLLRMAANTALPAGVTAATFSTEKKNLKERLEQIMKYKKTKGRALAALLALLLLCGCGAAAGPAAGQNASLIPTEEKVIEVSTVDELLAAIGPNTTVILAPGDYDLSAASDYGHVSDNPCYAWVQVPGGGEREIGFELQILGVENLILRGAGEGETSLLAEPRYANVLHFLNCSGLRVEKLTAGHSPAPGYCMGGVLRMEACKDVTVDACGLFGCGTVGVQAEDCSALNVTNCHIYECSYSAVTLSSCREVLVEGCTVERNGVKAGAGPACHLFTADFCEDFTVLGCTVSTNNCQTLLHTTNSKNALFLSCTVEKNRFDSCVFQLNQYPVTVDGCVFSDNETPIWILGGVFPMDIEGKSLAAEDLQAMQYAELDPAAVKPAQPAEAALELPAGGSVTVKTVDEFLSAIGPDRTVLLDGELFDLSTASNYGGTGGQYYYWQENYDGPALIINGVSGLTIRALSEDPEATVIAALPRYANVLSFRDCERVNLVGFTAGHTEEPGSCSGGVLHFMNCHGIGLEACRLYGCGILGVTSDGCTDLTLRDCEIYDCSQGGVHLSRTDGVRFLNCDIHDVPSPALSFFNCGDISWDGKPILGDQYDVKPDGTLQDLSLPANAAGSYATAEEGENADPYTLISLESLYPFDLLPPRDFREGGEPSDEVLVFARSMQQEIAEGNWDALSEQLYYPFHILTGTKSIDALSQEEFLSLDLDALLTPEFRRQIADAPLDSFGASLFGNTFCSGYLAFGQDRTADAAPLLRLTAISLAAPMPDNRIPEDLRVFNGAMEMTEFTLNRGDAVTLSTRIYPLGLFPDAEITWTVSDPDALQIEPSPDGRYCRIQALQSVQGGVQLTAEFRGVSRELKIYIVDPSSALPPTPAP